MYEQPIQDNAMQCDTMQCIVLATYTSTLYCRYFLIAMKCNTKLCDVNLIVWLFYCHCRLQYNIAEPLNANNLITIGKNFTRTNTVFMSHGCPTGDSEQHSVLTIDSQFWILVRIQLENVHKLTLSLHLVTASCHCNLSLCKHWNDWLRLAKYCKVNLFCHS